MTRFLPASVSDSGSARQGTGSSRQVEVEVVGLGVALLDDADGDGAQVDGLVRRGVGAVDDERVVEKLVGQPAEADGAVVDAADDGALARGVGLVGGELGLGADRRRPGCAAGARRRRSGCA